MENLVEEKGTVTYNMSMHVDAQNNTFRYHPSATIRFKYHYRYFYEGRQFLIGEGSDSLMIEAETNASCVVKTEISGKVTTDKIIKVFKDKCSKLTVSLDKLVERYNKNNADIDLWKISFLTH